MRSTETQNIFPANTPLTLQPSFQKISVGGKGMELPTADACVVSPRRQCPGLSATMDAAPGQIYVPSMVPWPEQGGLAVVIIVCPCVHSLHWCSRGVGLQRKVNRSQQGRFRNAWR